MENNYTTSSSTSSLLQNFNTSLHTVRKPSASKPWNKKPIAPLPPPTKPKVYQVDPMNFRDLVQKLTGQPEQRRLQRVAPPSLNMTEPPSGAGRDVVGAAKELSAESNSTGGGTMSFGIDNKCLMLSPSSYNWCANFTLLSPRTLSTLK